MGGFASKNHFPVDGRVISPNGLFAAIIDGLLPDNHNHGGLPRHRKKCRTDPGVKRCQCIDRCKGCREIERYHRVHQSEAKCYAKIRIRPNFFLPQSAALRPSQRFHYISADLKNSSESARIMSEATAWNENTPPDIIWCCAGSCRPELFIETPIEVHCDHMDTNYFSSVSMAHAALRSWLSPDAPKTSRAPATSEPRHIIFTSSILAFYPIVGYSSYTPSKGALRTLSDSLSQELLLYSSHTPIKIHTVFPATIFTASYEEENRTKPAITKKLEETDGGQTADEVAAVSIKGLERGEELITTSGALGYAMKVGSLGASRRNGWAVIDTITSWIVSVVIVFVRWDMDRIVKKWGKSDPVNGPSKDS